MKKPYFFAVRHLVLTSTLATISSLALAAGPVEVKFGTEGLCDQLRLNVQDDGQVYGRQINRSCHTGDYLVAGRKKNDGYTLFLAKASPGSNAGNLVSLELSGNGSKVEAYQMDSLNPPQAVSGYNGTTWSQIVAP